MSVGTRRHPRRVWPSWRTTIAKISLASAAACGSGDEKMRPTAYLPAGGSAASGVPSSGVRMRPCTHSRSNRRCGIWIRMPAPSPVLGSAPVAPRCSIRSSAFRPRSTTPCEACPRRCARKPTPQASCSKDGSYRPLCGRRANCVLSMGHPAHLESSGDTSRRLVERAGSVCQRPQLCVSLMDKMRNGAGRRWSGTAFAEASGPAFLRLLVLSPAFLLLLSCSSARYDDP